jgi:hypothetical protein
LRQNCGNLSFNLSRFSGCRKHILEQIQRIAFLIAFLSLHFSLPGWLAPWLIPGTPASLSGKFAGIG